MADYRTAESEERGLILKVGPPCVYSTSEPPDRRELRIRGILYANAMGLCSVVLVALGSTLSNIARRCGTTSTEVGTVFLARGFGMVLGAVLALRLYSPETSFARQRTTVVGAQVSLAGVLFLVPLVSTIWALHLSWGATGLCTALLDTGVQITTRDTHGPARSPFWLAHNTLAFAGGGVLVPLIMMASSVHFAGHDKIEILFACVGLLALANAAALWVAPPITQELRRVQSRRDLFKESSSYVSLLGTTPDVDTDGKACAVVPDDDTTTRPLGLVEVLFSVVCFFLFGGKVDATSYLTTYAEETNVIHSGKAPVAVLALWVALIVGRLAGLRLQIAFLQIRTASGARWVGQTFMCWLSLGIVGACLIAAAHTRQASFWVGLVVYGVGNGPSIGYCYDLINRISNSSVRGLVVVMLGLNMGSSLVPYATSKVWKYYGPKVLIYAMLLCMPAPLPFLVGVPLALERRDRLWEDEVKRQQHDADHVLKASEGLDADHVLKASEGLDEDGLDDATFIRPQSSSSSLAESHEIYDDDDDGEANMIDDDFDQNLTTTGCFESGGSSLSLSPRTPMDTKIRHLCNFLLRIGKTGPFPPQPRKYTFERFCAPICMDTKIRRFCNFKFL